MENENKEVNIAMGTLYDINKELVKKDKVISPFKINEFKKDLFQLMKDMNNKYYMLLCNDRKDFTIFTLLEKVDNKIDETINILIDECLVNRGTIRSLEITPEKDAVEIWLEIEEEVYCYYFFPYDAAIVEV